MGTLQCSPGEGEPGLYRLCARAREGTGCARREQTTAPRHQLGSWLEPAGYMFGFQGIGSGPQSPREIEAFVNELIGPVEAKRFWREYCARYITEEDFRFLAQTGINSIRVPVHYKYFLHGNDEGFALVDRVVG